MPLFLRTVVFAILCHHGFSEESGATTAQSVCDSMGTVGLYPNQGDTTCKQYVKCFSSNNALVGSFYNCTGSTLFNPNSQYCTTGYTCTVTTTTTTTSTSTTSTTTTTPETTTASCTTETTTTTEQSTSSTTSAPISAQSICDSKGVAGRYPSSYDTTCKQYANCFENNGSLTGSYYNCTGTTWFDPNLQLCSNAYKCNG